MLTRRGSMTKSQVAERFDGSYGVMRRVLRQYVTLRNHGGAYPTGATIDFREKP